MGFNTKEYNKKYYLEHREYLKKKHRKYDMSYFKEESNKIKQLYYSKKYYQENKIRERLRRKDYHKANKDKISKRQKIYFRKRKLAWLPYLKPNPKCEICNKQLNYFSRGNNGVYFDHKTPSQKIKTTPGTWLQSHYPTIENIKIWKVCNFGTLCNYCNRTMPSKNRKKWLRKVIRYVYEI